MKTKYKSLTLLELLLCLVLFSVIVLGISTLDIFGQFHAITSDRRALVQNELSFVMDHITKNITGGNHCSSMPCTPIYAGAIGDKNNPPFILDSDNQGFSIRWDNGCGISYNSDLSNGLASDPCGWVGYRQVGNAMYFYANDTTPTSSPRNVSSNGHSAKYEVIATHLLSAGGFVINTGTGLNYVTINTPGTPSSVNSYDACTITLQAYWNPNNPPALDNPQAKMQATIFAPAASTN